MVEGPSNCLSMGLSAWNGLHEVDGGKGPTSDGEYHP